MLSRELGFRFSSLVNEITWPNYGEIMQRQEKDAEIKTGLEAFKAQKKTKEVIAEKLQNLMLWWIWSSTLRGKVVFQGLITFFKEVIAEKLHK